MNGRTPEGLAKIEAHVKTFDIIVQLSLLVPALCLLKVANSSTNGPPGVNTGVSRGYAKPSAS